MGLKVQRKPAVLIAIGQGRTVFYIITASPNGQEKKTLPKREKNCYTIYIDGPVAQLGERLHGMQEVAAGRAPAWHAGGRKFDPCRVHHFKPRESGVFYVLRRTEGPLSSAKGRF